MTETAPETLALDIDTDAIESFFNTLTPVEMAAAATLGVDLDTDDDDGDLSTMLAGFAALAATRLGHDIPAEDMAAVPLRDLMRIINAAAATPPPIGDKVAALLATLPGN